MVKHRTRRWAAIIAKQNDVVTVTTITDPLEEFVSKNAVLIHILPIVKKEESKAIALGK
jgi:hypothetical protein